MSYESAPATKLLATHCCACGKELLDSKSVETGMGPTCRKRYGYEAPVTEEARKEANKIVFEAAAKQAVEAPTLARLAALGFEKLALKLAQALTEAGAVEIEEAGGLLVIKAPYKEEATAGWRTVPGRRWDKALKANTAPVSAKAAVWKVLLRYYPGALLRSAKGVSVVGAPAAPAPVPPPVQAELAWGAPGDEARAIQRDALSEANEDLAEDERERYKEALCEAELGPLPGTYAYTARAMAKIMPDFDWDAWKDEMKERE